MQRYLPLLVVLCMTTPQSLWEQVAPGQSFVPTITPPVLPFYLGRMPALDLSLENRSNHPIQIGVPPGKELGNLCRVDLYDEGGKAMDKFRSRRNRGNPNANVADPISVISLMIAPGAVLHRSISLQGIFEIAKPGVYKIKVSCYDEDLGRRVDSAAISVQIMPSSTGN